MNEKFHFFEIKNECHIKNNVYRDLFRDYQ